MFEKTCLSVIGLTVVVGTYYQRVKTLRVFVTFGDAQFNPIDDFTFADVRIRARFMVYGW